MESAAIGAPPALNAVLGALGVPGVAALGLIAFCAAFYFGTVRPEMAELSKLEQRKSKLETTRAASGGAVLTLDQQLAEFYSRLPKASDVEQVAQAIFDKGRKFGFTLRQGSYRYVPEQGSRFGRYEITYLSQTEYYRVRLMLRELMQEMPALALEDISVQRQQAAATVSEVTLKVALYVRQE
jgi:hypothetical protein